MVRRSQVRSSRGHVRVEQGPAWIRWAIAFASGVLVLVVVIVLITQFVLPALEDDASTGDNRTWLEFAWTSVPVNDDAVRQLGERLKSYSIRSVYLECAAWRADGTLLEGEHVAEFAEKLRAAYPEITILVWLRMSGAEIDDADRRAVAIGLAEKAVREWTLDGVQLNGRGVRNNSETFIQMVRALRTAIGPNALLSVTAPADRIPSDPDVPIGTTAEPDLTWDVNFKQRVALLRVDEVVVMPHASGLQDSAQYTVWVAYQVASYATAIDELDRPADIIVALPTYDAAPDRDPEVENVRAAIKGVKDGVKRAESAGELVKGVGLYEYKSTDSLEWTYFQTDWLGKKSG